MLIFSHISERDGAGLLETLAKTLKSRKVDLKCLILTTYDQRLDGIEDFGKLDLNVCGHLAILIYIQIAAFNLQPLASLMR